MMMLFSLSAPFLSLRHQLPSNGCVFPVFALPPALFLGHLVQIFFFEIVQRIIYSAIICSAALRLLIDVDPATTF
jgi:hypothetical protein